MRIGAERTIRRVVRLQHAEAGEGMKSLYLDAVPAILHGGLFREEAVSRTSETTVARAEAEVMIVRDDVSARKEATRLGISAYGSVGSRVRA